MFKLAEFTHIGRMIDPRYPTNLAILIWCTIVGALMLGFRLVSDAEIVQAILDSVMAGITVFMTWALAREIDPQEQLSAFVAVSLMTIVLFVVGVQFNLIVLAYMLTMSRIVNRSVGLPATLSDSTMLLLFTGFVGIVGSWIFALMGAAMFLLDSILPNRDRKHVFFGIFSVAIAIVAFVIQSSSLNSILPTVEYAVGMLAVTFIFVPTIVKSKHLTVIADATREPLTPIRVQALQAIAVLAGFYVAFWQGNQGVVEFLPLWVTTAGVSLFPLVKLLLPEIDLSRRKTDKLKSIS